jgi:hypothetical protein
MIPTYAEVTAAMRVHLGDTEVAAGQVWTDASGKCDPYIQQSYSELYDGMRSAGVRNTVRTSYGRLPAYTSYINPATLGVTNFGEPTQHPLWDRTDEDSIAITGAAANTSTPGAPYVRITAVGHTFSDGQMVIVFGIVGMSDDVNGQWSVKKYDANSFDLMGCTATGTYSSGGWAAESNQGWSEVVPIASIENYPQSPGASLNRCCWEDGAFRVYAASTVRQIKMIYFLSGRAPTYATPTASMGWDNSLQFLSYRSAALAALDRGAPAKAQALNTIALGPTQNHQDWGGLYGTLIRAKARGATRTPVIVGPYRDPRRNAGLVGRY